MFSKVNVLFYTPNRNVLASHLLPTFSSIWYFPSPVYRTVLLSWLVILCHDWQVLAYPKIRNVMSQNCVDFTSAFTSVLHFELNIGYDIWGKDWGWNLVAVGENDHIYRVYFWTFDSVPFIYTPILMPVERFLNYWLIYNKPYYQIV